MRRSTPKSSHRALAYGFGPARQRGTSIDARVANVTSAPSPVSPTNPELC